MPAESKEMNRALLGMCSVIRGLLAGAARDEVLTRRQVGEVVGKVRAMPDAYGQHCVPRIAEEVGMTAANLYRHIAVAECWTAAEVTALMDRTDRFGQPLSWSHLVLLAQAPDGTAREIMLEECLSSAWSVRELKEHMDRLKRSARDGRWSPARAVHATLREGIDFGVRASADVGVFTSALAERIDTLDEEPNPALVAEAIAAFEELQERARSVLAQLRGVTASERRIRCAAPAEAAEESFASEEPEEEARRVTRGGHRGARRSP